MTNSLDPRKLIAEAIGAFTLVFAGAGAVIVAAGNANIGLVEIALAHGLAIALMVSALGAISGGHFNPAVTAAMWVTRRIDSIGAVGYVVAQLAGAVLAALALTLLYPEGLRAAASLGTPALGPTVDLLPGIGIEAVLTFFLVIVIFGTAVDRRGPHLGGIAIGLTITMDVLAGGPLTGAAMNPARAFGPALVSGNWADHIVWWIGPLVGAVAAGLLYHYVFAEEAEE
ncbi:MAG: MIP family channel protein [Chloroflexi bacterium]|nr:MIP family channel protein [Chloroflexota bacterium]MDA1240632.1 MIP family channel protein [Chloroflexota bacterium]